MNVLKTTLLLAVIFIVGGCGSQKHTINRYYIIEKPDSISVPISRQSSPLKGHCEILPVDIYPAFASREIANRSSSHEIIYYKKHHWAIGPAKSLSLLLEDYLSHAGIFKGASSRSRITDSDFKLETIIYQLEIVQENEDLSAHLAMEFKLFDTTGNNLLLSHTADRMQKLQKKDLNLFAKTISKFFYEELNTFTQAIKEQIPERYGSVRQSLNDNLISGN